MSSSRSQTPTISHPLIRWIWEACESAILPHPTMATLSMSNLLSAAFKVSAQRLGCCDLLFPPEPAFELRIAIPGLLPVHMPDLPVEYRRQLLLRPARI